MQDIIRITIAILITTASAIVVINITRSADDAAPAAVGKESVDIVTVSVTITVDERVAVIILELDDANNTVNIILYH